MNLEPDPSVHPEWLTNLSPTHCAYQCELVSPPALISIVNTAYYSITPNVINWIIDLDIEPGSPLTRTGSLQITCTTTDISLVTIV